jgi:hypothetical protein
MVGPAGTGLVAMPDRRTILRAILLGSAGVAIPSGVAALGGCGVPTGGSPVVDGSGPSVGTAGLTGGGTPPGPDTATTPEELVAKYLLAVAGPLEDVYRTQLQNSARRFMTSDAADSWEPEPDVTVVRVVGKPRRREGGVSTWADITLQTVGKLTPSGMLMPTSSAQVTCNFELVNDRTNSRDGSGWRIKRIISKPANLSSAMLLDSAALDDPVLRLFTPQLLYYWPSAGQNALVPDLRYLPLAGSDQNRFTRIVNDLLSEPPSWLAVKDFPSAVLAQAAPDKDNNYLVVNIKLPAPGLDPKRLMTQLRWSLFPFYQGPVQLQINSQKQQVDGSSGGYRTANLADSPDRSPDAYCVAGGVVRPLRDDEDAPTILDAPLNRDVLWAALSRDRRMVAVVRPDGPGKYGLWIGDADTGPAYIKCAGLSSRNLGRPVWLPGQDRLVVLVDNRLYAVNRLGAAASDVTPIGVQKVPAFSVAPDGRRIALIADGVPAIASLSPADQSTGIGASERFAVSGLVELSAIAWSRMERVVVAGRIPSSAADAFGLIETTIDGAIQQEVPDVKLAEQITHLAAYPPAPSVQSTGMGRILGQAGSGKNVYSFEFLRQYRRLDQLQIQPSLSASASPKPVELTPTAPFFAD